MSYTDNNSAKLVEFAKLQFPQLEKKKNRINKRFFKLRINEGGIKHVKQLVLVNTQKSYVVINSKLKHFLAIQLNAIMDLSAIFYLIS